MKAVRIEKYGGPEVAQYVEVERPTPGEGELLVKVFASSINPVDAITAQGYLDGMVKLPITLGWDVAGTIEELGPGVSGFQVGESIYGMIPMRGGAYAEYAVLKAHEATRKPANLDYEQAAAVPLVALTAWQVLFNVARLEAGQTVLIHAAAGGVGIFAVQLAHNAGARVIGTASAKHADFVRSLGADEVIDYTTTPFEQVAKEVDVVLVSVGGDTEERSYNVIKPGGILVTIVGQPDQAKAEERNIRAVRVGVQPDPAILNQITQQIEAGKLKPVVSEVLPLSEVQQALQQSMTGHIRGKLVLKVVE